MLRIKYQDHRSFGSRDDDFTDFFCHIWPVTLTVEHIRNEDGSV